MKKVYPVIFTQVDHEVLVEVPDLGIFTEGKDIADAMEMARDAIGLKAISMADAMQEIPNPSELSAINAEAGAFANEGKGIVSLIDIDFLEYRKRIDNRTVRRNVTLPNWLNLEAEKAHLNVSKVLQDALMEKLQVER